MTWLNNVPIATDKRRLFKQSGDLYVENTTSIASSAKYIFDLDSRYIPYDEAIIVNLDTSNDCMIFINQHHKHSLPAGNRATLNGYNIRDLMVQNNGSSTISTSKIQVTYRYTGSQGEAIKQKASGALNVVWGLKSVFFK